MNSDLPQVPTIDEAIEASLQVLGEDVREIYRMAGGVKWMKYFELLKWAAQEAFVYRMEAGDMSYHGINLPRTDDSPFGLRRSLRIVREGLRWLHDHPTLPTKREDGQREVA